MESVIRNIIQEELKLVLFEMHNPSIDVEDSVEDILYDFEAGKSFGINKLAVDIQGLGEYYLSSYFPRSEMQENWMFEIESNYGGAQLIEITHTLKSDYKSYWEITISEVERGSDSPVIIKETGFIKGYEEFISSVNSTLAGEIDPSTL